MKKYFVAVIVLSLVAMFAAGCGGKQPSTSTESELLPKINCKTWQDVILKYEKEHGYPENYFTINSVNAS